MYYSKGFIYPAVLFTFALVMLIVNFTAPQFVSRHMFEQETKEYYTGENLLQNGALLSIRHILEHRPGRKGSQQFQYGHVSYDIRKKTIKEQQEITLKAITESGTEKSAQLLFDQNQKKLLSWTE
ncbi:competence type IV pilus minor pilin ComGG [Bacillus halotolerans]|uniref:competence type IV pilus minor pilin ComGG n=1 Tax=Bacillus halotolerans TaxID=260554 RepID=UPI0016626A2A|nr:competence type IV pilus minor pilin ComGG [Bacillus halotolerans]MBV7318014.1 competence protein ComG [Halalkalibacterium halodurans]MCM3353778.1 ComGG family competence protein [Bacillus halotolerans]QNS18725.1 competence protein ComG [Bacillus halotolerans]QVN26190.1 competence protein ComG [Bacillus halotolerans]WOC55433.1 competence type IV pilus minor pilin ComGG [Bacillus halotolerans]